MTRRLRRIRDGHGVFTELVVTSRVSPKWGCRGMTQTRKLVAILAADVVGYSRLAGADEDRTLTRLRALRGDLIDPAIEANHGRVVKQTGDASSSSSGAWSMPCAAPLRCRTA